MKNCCRECCRRWLQRCFINGCFLGEHNRREFPFGGRVNINFADNQLPLRLLLIGLLVTHPLGTVRSQSRPSIARVPELVFRKLINKFVMPVYPEGSLKRSEKGVAVAEVQLDEKGALIDVKVLEAPSGEIGNAVVDAIHQCEFRSAGG